MKKNKVVNVHSYLFDDKIKVLKTMIGLEIYQIHTYNNIIQVSECQINKLVTYNSTKPLKMFMRNNKKSYLLDLNFKSLFKQDYGNFHAIQMNIHSSTHKNMIYFQNEIQNLEAFFVKEWFNLFAKNFRKRHDGSGRCF